MRSFLKVFIIVLGLVTLGSHQAYGYEGNSLEKLNEVDSVDFHGDPLRETKYKPTWDSLDSRPLPAWYDKSKIGIFIHWGVFSVPGFSEWFWTNWKDGKSSTLEHYMEQNYKPGTTYQEFAHEFTAEFYNPNDWAKLFEKAGAKYIVLTSKHHDGYGLWPSRYSFGWNSRDVGPHRDLLGELAAAIRNDTDIRFGLYHSLYEWYNPFYLNDKKNQFKTDEFVRVKTMPELHELVNTYKPDVIWSDGDWEANETYWKSKEFLAWLYNESPVKDSVVTNDRWGINVPCKHGGYFSCADRYNPGTLQAHKWENAFTIDKHSWGYRRNTKVADFLTPEDITRTIAETVSCGGNILINVGPTREGTIQPIQQERLLQMGEWLEINGEAIYNSVPYTAQNDTLTPGVWYTMSEDKKKIYGIITHWPGKSITLASINPTTDTQVLMLGAEGVLSYGIDEQGHTIVYLPTLDKVKSKWAWTLVFI